MFQCFIGIGSERLFVSIHGLFVQEHLQSQVLPLKSYGRQKPCKIVLNGATPSNIDDAHRRAIIAQSLCRQISEQPTTIGANFLLDLTDERGIVEETFDAAVFPWILDRFGQRQLMLCCQFRERAGLKP
ncbi:hypothetical protein WJ40_31580 [Burkholderia cepacia]|nr:hypothetical protein WI25_22225 [Burkholderia cepacia]KVH56299.1 hypothetical protein WJ40_31580 [Burkholderia cepacia]